jgi:hypothetical protein
MATSRDECRYIDQDAEPDRRPEEKEKQTGAGHMLKLGVTQWRAGLMVTGTGGTGRVSEEAISIQMTIKIMEG